MFDLDWPVDRAGYRWVEQPARPGVILPTIEQPPSWRLEPCGGPSRFYRPLDEEPGLGRKFAALPLPADKETLLEFTNRYGLLGGYVYAELGALAESIQGVKLVTAALDTSGPRAAVPLFNNLFHPRFSIALDFAGAIPEFRLVPGSLYAALLLQVGQEVAGKVRFRKCKACPEWFTIGKGGATRRKEYCSPRCRTAAHRQHSSQGASR